MAHLLVRILKQFELWWKHFYLDQAVRAREYGNLPEAAPGVAGLHGFFAALGGGFTTSTTKTRRARKTAKRLTSL